VAKPKSVCPLLIRRSWIVGLSAAAAICLGGLAKAQVLEIGDDGSVARYDGPAVYSSSGVRSLAARPAGTGAPTPAAQPSAAIERAVASSAARYALSPDLLAAVAWRESAFRQEAVSRKGARGVMQLMPQTARTLGVDPDDLAANVDGGAAYLSNLLHRFDGDVSLALAAYNAGPQAVVRWGGAPPYRETRAYVSAILGRLASAGARP
jgi:soluble lytic murein transglycosylase-like protein